MKIVFRIISRFEKGIDLIYHGLRIETEIFEGDLFELLIRALKENKVEILETTSFEVEEMGDSRTSVNIAYVLGNAILYSLGRVKLSQLRYPEGPSRFYSRSKERGHD